MKTSQIRTVVVDGVSIHMQNVLAKVPPTELMLDSVAQLPVHVLGVVAAAAAVVAAGVVAAVVVA